MLLSFACTDICTCTQAPDTDRQTAGAVRNNTTCCRAEHVACAMIPTYASCYPPHRARASNASASASTSAVTICPALK